MLQLLSSNFCQQSTITILVLHLVSNTAKCLNKWRKNLDKVTENIELLNFKQLLTEHKLIYMVRV